MNPLWNLRWPLPEGPKRRCTSYMGFTGTLHSPPLPLSTTLQWLLRAMLSSALICSKWQVDFWFSLKRTQITPSHVSLVRKHTQRGVRVPLEQHWACAQFCGSLMIKDMPNAEFPAPEHPAKAPADMRLMLG